MGISIYNLRARSEITFSVIYECGLKMRIYNSNTQTKIDQELFKTLITLRAKRDFNPKEYLKKKHILLNQYMMKFNLSTCIIAVSGGIDSAVTLGIVNSTSKVNNSPIRKIIPVLLPVFSKEGATNQDQAVERGKLICRFFGIKPVIIDLTSSHQTVKNTVDKNLSIKGEDWASGQLVSYIRTPALYYISSLLSEKNLPAIICGTTNRDEGAYLGYFGKASDGMVDLQIISDIHKSEVYKIAELLNIPQEIINTVPSGDMYDGRSDEQVFGATYDFVELFLLLKSIQDKKTVDSIKQKWTINAKKQFIVLSKRLEKLHNYNLHKYLSGSSSIHLDIYERKVPGGWS